MLVGVCFEVSLCVGSCVLRGVFVLVGVCGYGGFAVQSGRTFVGRF